MKLPVSFAAIALAALAVPAVAALPPQWQRIAELKAILDSGELVRAFDGRPIDRIEYVRDDLYRVTADECSAYVTIADKPLPDGLVGPRRFEVALGKVECPAE